MSIDDLIKERVEADGEIRDKKPQKPKQAKQEAEPEDGLGVLEGLVGQQLSGQYLNSRKPLNSMNSLVIPAKKLLTLTGKDAEKYRSALEQILGEEVADTEFHIDRGGSALGYDVDDYIIIVSDKQRKCDIISDEFSFMGKLLDKVYQKAGPLVNQVSLGEALYGRVKTHLPSLDVQNLIMAAAVRKGRRIQLEVSLDTPTKAFETLEMMHDVVQHVRKDPRYVLSEDVKQVVQQSFEMKYGASGKERPALGNLRLIEPQGVFPVRMHLDFYKVRDDNMDLFGFYSNKPVLVYFEHKPSSNDNRITNEYVIVNGNDVNLVIDTFVKEGLFAFAPEVGELSLARMINQDNELAKWAKEALVDDMDSIFKKIDDSESPEAKKLRYAIQRISKASKRQQYSVFKSIKDIDTKLALIYPVGNDPVLFDFLSRLQDRDSDYTMYRNTTSAVEYINGHSDEEVASWLQKVSKSWQYEEQQNLWVNLYLQKKRPEAVEAAGMRFRK